MKSTRYRNALTGILSSWFLASVWASAQHVFVGKPGTPPLALLAFTTIPLVGFLGWYALSPGFRSFILSLDPGTLTFLQAWRIVGLAFVALEAFQILPSAFGLSAGYGDVFIGLTAPLVALKLAAPRSRNYFIFWQLLGIADLIAAMVLGVSSASGHPSTFAMSVLPLSVIPTFAVPVALMLHLVSIRQARTLRPAQDERRQARVQPSLA